MPNDPLYLRYLGALGLLCEASVHVPEEIREMIEVAMEDAIANHPLLWRRVLKRIELEPS